MDKTEYSFDDFLSEVNTDYKGFVKQMHELLSQSGYKIKIELKATGYRFLFVSQNETQFFKFPVPQKSYV